MHLLGFLATLTAATVWGAAPAIATPAAGPGNDAPDASLAAARSESPRRTRPWAVRTDAFVLSGSGGLGASATSVALSIQKTFFERWAWEETVGWGIGNRKVDGKDSGLNFAGTLRFAALLSSSRSSALSLGLGSALIFGGGYGRLDFAFAEVGYEYRARDGFSLLLALGPSWLYGSPNRSTCMSGNWYCEDFRRGNFAPLGHGRAGVGWSF